RLLRIVVGDAAWHDDLDAEAAENVGHSAAELGRGSPENPVLAGHDHRVAFAGVDEGHQSGPETPVDLDLLEVVALIVDRRDEEALFLELALEELASDGLLAEDRHLVPLFSR